jgi:hypothetical protein
MTTSMTMGLPGVNLAPGDHICAFYRGAEQRDQLLVPYLRDGLLAGDKCLCVTDDPSAGRSVQRLADDLDVDGSLASGQLRSMRSESCYLRGGCFDPDRMLRFWDDEIGTAVQREGYRFVRAVGEMTWALRDLPGVEHLLAYEARLNEFLPRYPQVILCLYDLERFSDGQILLEMLRTHPKVLLSGQLLDNPWYLEPDEYLALHASGPP